MKLDVKPRGELVLSLAAAGEGIAFSAVQACDPKARAVNSVGCLGRSI